MTTVRRVAILGGVMLLGAAAEAALASVMSDFQARLAQTAWSLQTVEGILRAQPLSQVAVSTPDALASHLTLLSENVSALVAASSSRATDEQRRTMAEGLKGMATQMKDLSALGMHRGLTVPASTLLSLESSCRAAIASL